MVRDSADIRTFDPTFIARLEVAFARRDLDMAIDLVQKQFYDKPPEVISDDSPVCDFYDVRLANQLEAIGIHTMRQLGNTRREFLLSHPYIGPVMLDRIRKGFELWHLATKKPRAESQKGETGH